MAFVSAQTALAVMVMYYMVKLNIFPNWLVIISSLFCAFMSVVSMFFTIGGVKLRRIIAAIMAAIFCVIAVIPVSMMSHMNLMLNKLQSEMTEYDSVYEIIVKKDDSANYLNDISKYVIGVDISYDIKSLNKAISEVENKINCDLEIVTYNSHTELWDAFMKDNEVDAIFIYSAFFEIFKELYVSIGKDINDDVKQLDNVKVTVQIEKPVEKEETEVEVEKDNLKLHEKPFALYVSGIDVEGSINIRSRSDVNILIVINPVTKRMVLATVPRDTYVPLKGVSHGEYDKLTHAGIYGKNCSVSIATLEEYIYTGINIDRWIRVNFSSLERIVDALDGIEVESKFSFSQNGYYFNKGTNYLDGERALAFCRNRKSFAEGEQQRGKNQLEVIKGIFNKAISPAILKGYSDVFDEIIDSVQTNLSADDITGLVKMQLTDGAKWDIQMAAIEVDYTYDYCYSMPDSKLCVGIMNEESRLEVIDIINSVINE